MLHYDSKYKIGNVCVFYLLGAQAQIASPKEMEKIVKRQGGKNKTAKKATVAMPFAEVSMAMDTETAAEEPDVEFLFTTLPRDLQDKKVELIPYSAKEFRYNYYTRTVPIKGTKRIRLNLTAITLVNILLS
jgi:hypothetical protein